MKAGRPPRSARAAAYLSACGAGASSRAVGWGPGAVPVMTSNAVGHKSTHVTDAVYGYVIRPTIRGGATMVDDVFGDPDDEAENQKTARR